jgi:hypothetical protein
VTLLVPRILRWLLDFWKSFVPLVKGKVVQVRGKDKEVIPVHIVKVYGEYKYSSMYPWILNLSTRWR